MKKLGNILDKYLLNRVVFKIVLIISVMITSVPFLHVKVGGYIKYVLLYGILIVGYEFIRGKYKTILKDKGNILLALFSISYLITILVNRDLNLTKNIKALAYMVVFFILLYMFTEVKNKSDLIKEINLVSGVVVGCTFVLSFLSFLTFVFSISGHYWTESGFIYYGMYENRLWGVYNANTGSTLNCISMMLSAVFLARKGSRKSRVFNIINMILQFVCLVLTSSRGPYYAFVLVVLIAAVVAWIRKNVPEKVQDMKKIVIRCMCVALVVICGFTVAKTITKSVVAYIPSAVKMAGIEVEIQITENAVNDEKDDDSDDASIKKSDLNRLDVGEDSEGGLLSSRPDLWQASLQAFKESPIWGITRENLYNEAVEYLNNPLLAQNMGRGGSHNIYICVLVSSGIVGFILLVLFVIYTMFQSIPVMLHNIKKVDPWMIMSLLLLIMFFIAELVESRILYQVNVFYVLFWTYYGYLGNFAKMMNTEEGKSDAE